MAIPIEGLVSREPIQEKNSTPSKRYRLINGTTENYFSQGGKFNLGRFALRLLGSAGLMAFPLIVACSPDAKAVPPSPATIPPEATATFVPGGFGGPEPIATYSASDPRAERLNPIIDRINKSDPTLTNDERNAVTLAGSADRTATVVAGGKIPPEGTKTPKTEAKLINCGGFFDPSNCLEAVRVQWRNQGTDFDMIAFKIKKGGTIVLPENMQVAVTQVNAVDAKGNYLIAKNADNTKTFRFWGPIQPTQVKTTNFPAGVPIGEVVDENDWVFKNYDYNLALSASPRELMRLFPELMAQSPIVIQREGTDTTASKSARYFDLPAPGG